MPAGRPTNYREEYCETVIEHMSRGLSKAAVAGKLLVSYDSILDWEKAHPEFRHAVKIGQMARTAFLEEGLLSEEVGPRVTARIFALKNACPAEWRDKIEASLDGTLVVEVRRFSEI